MAIVGIIPARYGSTRLPGKPLSDIHGKYRREVLLRFASLPPTPLEEAEGLEQLRALHHGMRIRGVQVDGESGLAVEMPEDLERVRALLASENGRVA